MIRDLATVAEDVARRRRGVDVWIVSQVGSGTWTGYVKLKRTSTSAETRWVPYVAGLTLAVNDRVELVGGVNGGLVVAKI